MKKFTVLTTFVLFMMFGLSSMLNAQNLALNNGFESWATNGAGGPPDEWTLSGTSMTGAQESVNVRTGSFSTNLTWTTTSTRYLQQFIAITAGENYEFTFWVLDNDPNGRARVTIRWYDSGGGFISGYYGDYSVDNAVWQQLVSGSQLAPANAVSAHIEIRVYDVSWSGTATVYVDDAEFTHITALEISQAYSISETAMDILYSADIQSVNAADYTLTGTANITFSGATIDGANARLVHLTGASQNMVGDVTLDNIDDAANSYNYDFYAGIMPVAYTNAINPGGTMNNTNMATFSGIVSANDGYNNVWFSDATGGYNGVMIYSSSFDAEVAVGDDILFTANRTTYNNLSELEYPTLLSTVSTGNSPHGPTVIPGSDIDEGIGADTNPAEQWEGQFVKIENFTVDSYVDYEYTCSWSDGGTTYHFRIGDNVDYHFGNIALVVGDTYASISGVVDWNGTTYRINPRQQSDIVASTSTVRIVGSMQNWNTTDPDYVMAENANGIYELTKSLDAGDHEYKVIEGDDWSFPNYPGNNQHVILAATENVTWRVNNNADLVTHLNPVVAGNFLSVLGGNDWDPAELMGEMTDPDGDDIFTLELVIPQGSYEGKVTLNHNWDQSTGGNVPFTTDGVNATVFTYDFPNNVTTISGPPPPTATITFVVDDSQGMNYDGFFLKGSWDEFGNYDPSWGNGAEHSEFFDDGTNGDETAGDHIWTCQQDLSSDGGSNTWEWGINDTEHNWIAGNWQFSVPDSTAQTLSWTVPNTPYVIINEIMYNSPGTDEEWVELYNDTDAAIDLEGWILLDSDAGHSPIQITAGYSIPAFGYFTIMVATDGFFPFTPDFDGTGNFALNNGGDVVRIYNADGILVDFVEYDDGGDWPSQPDGNGPTLSLIVPDLDNSLAASWAASSYNDGTPAAYNFPIRVTAPNGGEIIELATTYDITWDLNDWTGDIKIELIREGQNPMLIVSGIPASDELFSWFVFESIDVADDYKILISGLATDSPFDESDDVFSIIEHYNIPLLVLTEIMYNPPEAGTDSLEFVEIFNNGEESVNLEGIYFSQGVEFVFPNVELLPDSFLLVAVNSASMMETFGVDALEWTDGALSNSGETIELMDIYDNVIDIVDYDDALPWDTLADGFGPSLTLCNADSDNNIAENWTHSVNFAATNAVGDSIWATPGFGCQVELFASFEADVTFLSIGNGVMFTDLTIGDPIEWTWTFEGGTPDTWSGQTPPEIIYNEVGLYDVTLFVSDGINTDEITLVEYIEVVDFPAPTNLVAVVNPYDDVQLTWNAPAGDGFEDDFESYDDFVIEFQPWTNIDVDGSTTYGMENVEWPNAYVEQAFIIFNPSQTTPPVDDIIPHSGDKLAACFAATAPPNDDWMIAPMTNIADGFNVSFWAKSYTDQYGLERFRVGVSTTGTDPADFTIISEGDYVEAPVEEWTEFTYDLSAYAGQSVYVGIQCVSNDAFIFLVDDFFIGATKSNITYNTGSSVIGKGTKTVSYNAKPVIQPVETSFASRNLNVDLLGYNVYRDDVQINAAIVEVTEYNDPEPPIASHDYYVTAVYEGGESDPSNVVSVVVTGMNELSLNSVAIYPNPTDGMFTIAIEDDMIFEVSVMTITGQEVYRTTINQTSQVNVSDLQKGIYLVRLLDKSSNNILIKKLIVR